jgi:sulfur carrier protein ThiS
MQKTLKVGKMPGRLQEIIVDTGTSIAEVIRIAELDASGFEVKVDGATVSNIEAATVTDTTNLVLLAQKVKGNSGEVKSVKVGKMPGRLQEFAVEVGTSVADVLALAELDASGFEVKVDGTTVANPASATVTSSTNLILLAQKVKGNA